MFKCFIINRINQTIIYYSQIYDGFNPYITKEIVFIAFIDFASLIVQYNDYTVVIKIIVQCNITVYFLTIFTTIMRFCYGIYLYYGKAYRKNENKNQCKYFLYAKYVPLHIFTSSKECNCY